MLDAVARSEVLDRILSVRDGKNPYPAEKRQFWWALETADREALGDAYVDLFDPRPLNRQVLEASGGYKTEVSCHAGLIDGWEFAHRLWTVAWFPKSERVEDSERFFAGGDHWHLDIELRTIGDFRRFCSLPGIEIEVVVPEDYKP